jgi:chemotaxis signal transduction protein
MTNKTDIEYLCCRARQAGICIDVNSVQEVFETRAITRLPGCPPFITGMANLRGAVIPVIDLLGVFDPLTLLLKIVALKTEHGLVGLLISNIEDLVRLQSISPAAAIPEEIASVAAAVTGSGTHEGREYFALDIPAMIRGTLSRTEIQHNE